VSAGLNGHHVLRVVIETPRGLVAVDAGNERYSDIRRVSDLSDQFLKELEAFFVNYHKLAGEEYRIIKAVGPNKAWKIARDRRKS
jgi:inorganic pyrophosphatase